MNSTQPLGPFFSAASSEFPNALSAQVQTPRTVLESVSQCAEDEALYRDLFMDERVDIDENGQGSAARKQLADSLGVDATVWGVGCPTSSMHVRRRGDHKLMGIIGMTPPNEEGRSSLEFAFKPEFWHQGYGSEAVGAYVTNILPFLALEPSPFGRIRVVNNVQARARPDNSASCQILKKCGFRLINQESVKEAFLLFELPPDNLKSSLRLWSPFESR